jgi:DNA replication protein DnaC
MITGGYLFFKEHFHLLQECFDKEGSELLFTHLSLRASRKSTIITTNLSFDRWEEIFSDAVMTAAMIDRLTHKSYLLNMNGNSYRLKETKEWLAGQEKEEKDELN